ncbi:MAG: hydroxyacid dehydrogenase [Thermoplasmata archaeon]|jgi:D-3-phosphoglycerate dehydrogenase
MTDLPVIVIADPIDAQAVELLRGGPCRVVDASAGPEALAGALPEAWGLVVRSRTKVTADLIARAPKLSIIARAGVGVDNVDLPAAGARGIRVVNAPGAATQSVVELSVALYLLLIRGLQGSIDSTRGGRWDRSTHGRELAGKTVGFVGYGRIARGIAAALVPFRIVTRAYDPLLANSPDATPLMGLDEVLSGSDIVSIHAALTPQNHHLINAAAIAKMRRGSYLVNVARGALVDEAALFHALESGHLGGAALDVFETEPPTRTELLRHPRFIPTPHIGAATVEGQARAGRDVVDELLRALRGEPLMSQVPAPGARP